MTNDDKAAARRALGRERTRRWRRRLKIGVRRISVDLPSADLDDALIDGGYLAAEHADDAEAVRLAAEKFARDALETVR